MKIDIEAIKLMIESPQEIELCFAYGPTRKTFCVCNDLSELVSDAAILQKKLLEKGFPLTPNESSALMLCGYRAAMEAEGYKTACETFDSYFDKDWFDIFLSKQSRVEEN